MSKNRALTPACELIGLLSLNPQRAMHIHITELSCANSQKEVIPFFVKNRQFLYQKLSPPMLGTTFVVLHWDRFKTVSDLHCLFLALHCAASRGYNKIVELLVRECKGLQVDVEDKYGCTPLFYAASHNQPTTVHSLLSYGANPDHQDKKGRTWVYHIRSFIPI